MGSGPRHSKDIDALLVGSLVTLTQSLTKMQLKEGLVLAWSSEGIWECPPRRSLFPPLTCILLGILAEQQKGD